MYTPETLVLRRFVVWIAVISIAFTASAQSTERYIRVIGQSDYTYKANSATLTVTVSEQQANEYRNVPYLSVDENVFALKRGIAQLGIDTGKVELALPETSRNLRTASQQYTVPVSDLGRLNGVYALAENGIQVSDIAYDYDAASIDPTALSIAAIDDARRKATALAEATNLKLGPVLNIEDRPLNLPKLKRGETEQVLTHTVTVTFGLND